MKNLLMTKKIISTILITICPTIFLLITGYMCEVNVQMTRYSFIYLMVYILGNVFVVGYWMKLIVKKIHISRSRGK